MRWSLVALIVLAAGCAHLEPASSTVSVVAAPEAITCAPSGSDVAIRLSVHNVGPGQLTLGANDESGPPYSLNWIHYNVLSNQRGKETVDYEHGPGGHGRLPMAHVTLGLGDTADFVVKAYELTPASSAFSYRIELQDLAGNSYLTQPFGLCLPGSTPNNSFKPKPLRGSA